MTTRVDTECKVRVYEVDDEKVPVGSEPLVVRTHWNENASVRLTVGGKTVTVIADDLVKAIVRCS